MEQIKIYDKYIERLSIFSSLQKPEQEKLVEEIVGVIFTNKEAQELALSYYTPYCPVDLLADAEKLKSKIELMKSLLLDEAKKEADRLEVEKMALEKMRIQAEMQKTSLIINNHNEAVSSASVSVSFEDVRKRVDDMTSLSEEEINEIKNKIDEIEKIVNSKETKSKKWSKAKEIIKWIADKGVDVGIALLPLLLKIS